MEALPELNIIEKAMLTASIAVLLQTFIMGTRCCYGARLSFWLVCVAGVVPRW